MSQLEDLLRGAYGEEKFTMTVSDIETRGHRIRRRRTIVTLATAAGLAAAALLVIYVVVPWRPATPPVTGPLPSVSATRSAHPVSRVHECRERMAEAGQASLQNVEPVEVSHDRGPIYIFSDGIAIYTCELLGTDFSSSSIKPSLATPLSRTLLGYFRSDDLIVGPLPYAMDKVVYFDQTGSTQLDTNGTVFYGLRPVALDFDFDGIKASSDGMFTAVATSWRGGTATTRADQESACRAVQMRMPIPSTNLKLLDRRDVDSQTSALLLADDNELMAVCDVSNRQGRHQVHLTVANHPIYDSLLERQDTSTPVHRAVALAKRLRADAGKGRVVLSNGQKAPLVFANGYAIVWFDRPEGVQADHIEVDLSSGGHADYPLPLR